MQCALRLAKMDQNKKKENSGVPPQKDNQFSNGSPLIKPVPNIFSRMFFCWMFPIYFNGMSRDLEEYDLVPAQNQHDSKAAGDRLEK